MKLTLEMKGLIALQDEYTCRLVYSKHRPMIELIIANLTNNPEEVETIINVIFVKVFAGVQNLTVGISLSPWIAKIAFRICNEFKANKEKFMEKNKNVVPVPKSREHFGIEEYVKSPIYLALDQVEREFVFLHIVHGLSYRELSIVFDMDINRVKAKMKEIEIKLEKYIKGVRVV